MRDFGPWLRGYQTNDPALSILKQAAIDHAADWPYDKNEIAPYRDFVVTHVDEAERSDVLVLLGRLHEAWTRDSGEPEQAAGLWAWLSQRVGTFALIAFGIVVAAIIIWALLRSNFVKDLAEAGNARGLITFLVAITTISVALLTSISVFYVNADELENRFSKAKDVLAILVGILGTILGFYFGSAETTPAPEPTGVSGQITPGFGDGDPAAEGGTMPADGAGQSQ
jgi:hypothetical protein